MALITRAGLARLDEALAWIDAHPEQHDQKVWMERTSCGTVMCLAGVLVMLAGGTIREGVCVVGEAVMPDETVVFIPQTAEILLETDCGDVVASWLFECDLTREDLQRSRDKLAASL